MSDEKPVDFKDNMINSIATDNNSQFSLVPTAPEPESENDVQETE